MSDEKSYPTKHAQQVAVTVVETVEEEKQYPSSLTSEAILSSPKLTAAVTVHPAPLSPADDLNDTSIESHCTVLPPTDRGLAAWRVLVGAILTQGMLFAFPLTFGVFQDYFSSHQRLSNSAHSIWIGVLSTGVPFMGAPFMTAFCETRSPVRWKYFVLLGWAVCTLSLVGAAFAKRLLVLGITQGVLYGVGLMLLDVPVLLILNTWFVKRRGLAYGLLFGTTDLIGFGATIMAGRLLRDHNLERTLLTFAGCLLVISGPCMWLLRRRLDDTSNLDASNAAALVVETEESTTAVITEDVSSDVRPPVSIRYYRRPTFYIFALANLFHALAYYLPFLYLPSYATSLGLTSKRGAWLLAGANFAQVFGEVAFGQLSDSINIHCLVLICTLASSVSALALWGPAQSFTMLAFFALVFGAFGSGLIALWARMGTYFDQKDALMIFSIMSFSRGLASILSGPISSALENVAAHRTTADTGRSSTYGNGKYLGIVLFVGFSMGMSALTATVGLVGTWQRKKARTIA